MKPGVMGVVDVAIALTAGRVFMVRGSRGVFATLAELSFGGRSLDRQGTVVEAMPP